MTGAPTSPQRRLFLRGAAAAGIGLAFGGPFAALANRSSPEESARATCAPIRPDYGPLRPVRDQATGLALLHLPRGFEYTTFGWTGDEMSDGRPTPGNHDGMAAFRVGERVHLVRNHERDPGASFAGATATYDAGAAGGTTTLVFDPVAGALVQHHASLGGTLRNCAGGPTPAGTWLTCEETTDVLGDVRHGYVFEVPATGVATPEPLRAMGRFKHEATATDPDTGIVYETEDADASALYRFVPADPDELAAGGELQAMRLDGTDTTVDWATGTSAAASWVVVDEPDWLPGEPTPWEQASAKGAARIIRGEGAWYGSGVVYVVSTSGGPVGQGQVFAYDPVASTFTCVYASPSAAVLSAPDNVCVSPAGGLVLCEDSDDACYLRGLSDDGVIFPFARNDVVLSAELRAAKGYAEADHTSSEWAGACFDPGGGGWLFANLQDPGLTVAITGPWCEGSL